MDAADAVARYQHAATLTVAEMYRTTIRRVRLRIGASIMGADWFGVVGVLWLIRDRAREAIRADGSVILADCQPLADALYSQLPGRWKITITRLDDSIPDKPSETASATEDAIP